MNKREFLKAGSAGIVAAALAAPVRAAPRRRIAVVQPGIAGADDFAQRQRAAGAAILVPSGDPVRWFRATLRPALAGAEVIGFTDACHALVLEGSLREAGYARSTRPAPLAGGTLWCAVPRAESAAGGR